MVSLRMASILMFLISVLTEVTFSLLCVLATANHMFFLLMIWDGLTVLIWLLIFVTDDTASFDMADDIISTIMLPVASVFIGAMFKLPILYFHFANLESNMETYFGSGNLATSMMGLYIILLYVGPWFLVRISPVSSNSRAALLCKKFQMEGFVYLIDFILFYQSGLLINNQDQLLGKVILGFSLLVMFIALVWVSFGMYLFGLYAFEGLSHNGDSRLDNSEADRIQNGYLDTLLSESDLGKAINVFATLSPWISDLPLGIIRVILHHQLYDKSKEFDDIGGFMLFKNLVFLGRGIGRCVDFHKARIIRRKGSSYDTTPLVEQD